jgi:hypothetical protein
MWGIAFLVLVVLFIILAIFWCSCSPAKCCVFDPACCATPCTLKCENLSFVPFSGNEDSVALTAEDYLVFGLGAASVAGTLADINIDLNETGGFAVPFPSAGFINDLTAWLQAKADSGTAVVTVSVYVAPKSSTTPTYTSVLSGSVTATTTQSNQYLSQVGSSSYASVHPGDLYAVVVTTSAPITFYGLGGGFNYHF